MPCLFRRARRAALRGRCRPARCPPMPRGDTCFGRGIAAWRSFLRAVADALAQESRRPEDEHGDEHQEREHVLVVGAEQREIWIIHTTARNGIRPILELAEI